MADNNQVTVYSTSWCGFCKMVKSFLQSRNIEFKEVDIEADPAAAEFIVNKTGQMGVPVTTIGDIFIVGFDRPKLEAALDNQAKQ